MNKLLLACGWLCLILCTAPHAEEAKAGKAKAAEAQKPLGTQGSWHGRLGNGKFGAPASLRTASPDKKAKSFKSETFYLWAEGEVYTQLLDLKKKGATVDVSGLLAPDGKNVKVETLTDKSKQKGKGNKGKNKKP